LSDTIVQQNRSTVAKETHEVEQTRTNTTTQKQIGKIKKGMANNTG
jgi:hypothetical protein